MERIKQENINTKEYWDSFSNDAYQEVDRKRGGNRCKFSTVRDLITETSQHNFLDIGCLNGNFYNFLKESEFMGIDSFTGVDISDALIERAKNRFPEQEWLVADCEKLPFDDNSFDVVTLMEILEHVENPKKALQEARRVCKSEGSIIITVPNEERIKDASHVWAYTASDIFELLTDISKNIQVVLTCSNNRNIVGKAIIDYPAYF